MSNGDFIVTDKATGDQVTLNADFQSGDFGIILESDFSASFLLIKLEAENDPNNINLFERRTA
jgi:hypothetical protein